jgi:DNA repair protein RadC
MTQQVTQEQFVEHRTEVLRQRDIEGIGNIADLVKTWGLTDSAQERLWVVSYDAARNLRIVTEVARGGYNDVTVSIPALLTAVLMSGTDRFVIVHNHPAGDVTPTVQDLKLTKLVQGAADTVGLSFEDHIIVGPPNEYYSMNQHHLLVPSTLAQQTAAYRAQAGQTVHPLFGEFHHCDE